MKEVLDKLAKQRNEMESKYRARIAELKPKEELAKVGTNFVITLIVI